MDDLRHPVEGPDVAAARLSEPDQALADAAQVLGDRARHFSDSDQQLSDHDQRASDEDQAASDLEVAKSGANAAHTRATAVRAAATRDCEKTSGDRDESAHERDTVALRRDESSTLRDLVADGRDEEARRLDASDDVADRHTLGVGELRGRGRSGRRRAAADRAQAACDRALSTGDREYAADDRERSSGDRLQAAHDRDLAGTDELTGARRRGVGLEELDNEMKRARRESDSLVAAYIDVDGLEDVNDGHGHAAGDALLREVADGFRRHMRPYDLFVRLGGDEFLCALPDVSEAQARKRFETLRGELKESAGSSVSIGYSALRESDSADDLVRRAAGAMLAHRRE